MCLTASGGLPLFTKRKGEGEPVSYIVIPWIYIYIELSILGNLPDNVATINYRIPILRVVIMQ